MKKLFLTLAAGLFILTSCSKDDPIETKRTNTSDSVIVVDQTDGSNELDALTDFDVYSAALPDYSSEVGPEIPFTEGNFSGTNRNAFNIIWTGTQVANTAYGEGKIKQDSPNSSFLMHFVAECISVDGNEAVFGALITKVKGVYSELPNVGKGWRVYFKVFDAGLGLGSSDQIANNVIFASPKSMSLCNYYGPQHAIWAKNGFSNVEAPGYVIVGN